MLNQGGNSDRERIAHGFRLAISRAPTDAELNVLLSGFEYDCKHFEEHKEDAQQLVRGTLAPSSGPVPDDQAVKLAAYTLTANILLNLDEFVTRE